MREAEAMLGAYLDHLRLERRLSPRTVSAYRSDLRQHLRFLEEVELLGWDDVGAQTLRDDLARLAGEGRSRRSQQRYRSALRSFYRFLRMQNWMEADPSGDLEGPRVAKTLPRNLSVDEARRLCEAASGSEPLDLRDRAMIELAYGAGLRVSELVDLGAEDVDLENRGVRVRGKGNRERLVPLGHSACAATAAYLRSARAALLGTRRSGRLFVNRRGKPLTRMGFYRILRRRGASAQIDARRLHPHLLRHSFATHMLQAGASLRVVQELLGHRSLATTEIYTAVDRGYLRKVHRLHHPRGGGKGEAE